MSVFGGIESGGTKWQCAVGTGPEDVRAAVTIPTTSPGETIARTVEFFQQSGPIEAIGIGSFGPIDRRPGSPTWGYVTTTPKPGWAHVDLAGEIGRGLSVPVAFDTDVNAAALGEHRWGAARELDTFCYVTVGTGIGGGAVVGGRLLHGLLHPEFGHLRIPHDLDEDPFAGSCPYHGDCWEGLASGTALEGRWGAPGAALSGDEVWSLEARYLALGLVSVLSVLSPERIVIGGGVMEADGLLERVRREIVELLNDYLEPPALRHGMDGSDGIDGYVTAPALGARAGVLGAIALAESMGSA